MTTQADENRWRKGWVKTLLLTAIAVAIVSGTGVVVGHILVRKPDEAATGSESSSTEKGEKETVFVDFGSVVVNLAEGRLTRYLKVSIAMRVKSKWKAPLKKMMKSGKQSIFKNWLITYLSDLTLDDVKGSESIRKLREDVREGFNRILKEQGDMQVEEVLFKEFKVQ